MQNLVKQKLQKGEASIGSWISSGSPLITEVICSAPFDWVTIDLEHTAISMRECLACIYAVHATGKTPFVRVPRDNSETLKRVLDFGALGVVIPDIRTPEQARQTVQACRYPPEGIRGIGSSRGQLFYGPDYYQRANREICVVLMIEHIQAVEQIDAIMQVSGADAFFIGPNDLASSLGAPLGLDNSHPKHVEEVGKVLEAGKRHGVPIGIHCGSIAELYRRIEEGFTWLAVLSDIGFVAEMAAATFRASQPSKTEPASNADKLDTFY